MVFQLSTAVRNAMGDAIETTVGVSPTMEIRSGTPVPANAAAADVGTVLASAALPADWLAAGAAGAKTLLGTWQDAAADATGRATHFRVKQGATTHIQGLVSMPHAVSTAFSVGDQVTNGGNLYRASVAGTTGAASPPTGTGAGITDGGVTWNFVQAGADMSVDNIAFALGQQFTVTAFTLTMGGA
jgi:hypothetical protein